MIHVLHHQTDEIKSWIDRVFTDSHVQSVSNEETFDFTMPADAIGADAISELSRILIPSEDGDFREFIVSRYFDSTFTNKKEVYTSASFIGLRKAKIISPVVLEGQTVIGAAQFVLSGLDWQVGVTEYSGIRKWTIDKHMDAYDALKAIASLFECELRFRVTTDGSKITGRYVDFIKKQGMNRGKETVFGKDLIDIKRTVDAERIVTALFVLGPERDDGSRHSIIVEDKVAFQNWNHKGQHLIHFYEPSSLDKDISLADLTKLGEAELKKRITAAVDYEIEAVSLEHILGYEHEITRVGDTLRIKDENFNPPMYLEARVTQIDRSIFDKSKKTFRLGEVILYKKEDVMKVWRDLQALYATKVIKSPTAPPGRNNVIWIKTGGLIDIVHTWNGSSWVRATPTQAEEVGSYNQGTIDQKVSVVDQKVVVVDGKVKDVDDKVKVVDEKVIAVEEEVGTVKEEVQVREYAIPKQATAPENPYMNALWLDTTTNRLKKWNGTIWTILAPVSASDIGAIDTSTYNTKMQQIANDLSSKAGLSYVDGKLVLKADSDKVYSKTEVDNAVNSRVSVTSYTADQNGVVSRFNSVESRLTLTEQGLTSKVSQTEFNNLTIGGRNIVKGTSSEFRTATFGGWDYYFAEQLKHWTKGMEVTGRIYLKPATYEASIMIHVRYTNGTYSQYRGNVISAGSEGYSTITVTLPNRDDISYIQYSIRHSSGSTPSNAVQYKEAKIEKGNKATDWSPAPEDIDASLNGIDTRLTSAETALTQTANDITLKANKTDVYTKGEVNTALGNKADVSRVTSLESSLSVANDAISQRVTKTELDNLQIGGRNIFRQSGNFGATLPHSDYWANNSGGIAIDTAVKWNGYNTIKTTVGSGIQGAWYKLENGVEYTFSAMIKSSEAFTGSPTVPLHYWAGLNNTSQGKISVIKRNSDYLAEDLGKFKLISMTFKLTGDADSFKPFIYWGSGTRVFNIAYMKLEKGSKATDYSPAPEDIDASISGLTTRITTAEASITTQAGQIQSKVSQATYDADIPNLKTRMTSAESSITQQAGLISSKVSQTDYNGNTVMSMLNQTATTIKLVAENIEFNGQVFGQGATFAGILAATEAVIVNNDIFNNVGGAELRLQTGVLNGSGGAYTNTGHAYLNSFNETISIGKIDANKVRSELGGFYVDARSTFFSNNVFAGGYLDVTGTGKFGGTLIAKRMDSSADLVLTAATSIISLTSSAQTAPHFNLSGNSMRLKQNANNYIAQFTSGDIEFYKNGGRMFGFNTDVDGHSRIAAASAILKSLTSSPKMQVRNSADTAYADFQVSKIEYQTMSQFSKQENKKAIEQTDVRGLETVRGLKLYDFLYKEQKDDENKNLGVLWHEIPELLKTPDGVDVGKLNFLNTKAIQELDSSVQSFVQMVMGQVQLLLSQNNNLKNRVEQLERTLLNAG